LGSLRLEMASPRKEFRPFGARGRAAGRGVKAADGPS
jgi:hypothetical protein